jgi:hypothetical protein
MATIDRRDFIEQLIAGNGRMPDDQEPTPDNPRAVRIVESVNFEGRTCWGVVFENERVSSWDRYERPTEYVRNPRVLWRYEGS